MATDYPKILYESRLRDALPVASSTAAGSDYNVQNLRDFRSFTWWKPAALPATVTVDCGTPKTADYFAVYGHELGSKGVTIEIRGSTDNFAASNVLVATYAPASDVPIVRFFTSVAYRYWRVRLVNGAAPALAIVLVGNLLDMPEGVGEGFDPLGRKRVGVYNRSQGGEPLGIVVQREDFEQSVSFKNVSWTWMRNSWLAAWRAHLRAEPFLFSWYANGYPEETMLVAVKDSFGGPHKAGALADLSVTFVGKAN